MGDDVLQHLFDVSQAGQAIRRFIGAKAFDAYVEDELLRSAVERKFEIIGEALRGIGRPEGGKAQGESVKCQVSSGGQRVSGSSPP